MHPKYVRGVSGKIRKGGRKFKLAGKYLRTEGGPVRKKKDQMGELSGKKVFPYTLFTFVNQTIGSEWKS